MQIARMFAAPLFAAITAFTVSTQVDVPIQRVYVPLVVFGAPFSSMQDDRLSSPDKKDVTPDQMSAAESLAVSAGIPRDRIRSVMQTTSGIRIGVLLLDMGTPQESNAGAAALARIHADNVAFGWNTFVSVDCSAMNRDIETRLRERARQAAGDYTGFAPNATISALSMTSDPRTPPFDPIPRCPKDTQPVVHSAGTGGMPPRVAGGDFIRYASANVAVSFDGQASPAGGAASVFPFSTFGFPEPIIGHQNRAFVLRGGRFAATPGASEVVAAPDASVVHYQFRDPHGYGAALQALKDLRISPDDYAADGTDIYVRLRPATRQNWSNLSKLGEPQGSYRFVRDCGSFRRDARAVARERSRDLAQAAARVLRTPLGPLVVDTDWAGPSTDAICGSDGSGTLADVIAFAKLHGYAADGDPTRTDFWESLYAAWRLGKHPPAIVSSSIVDRLKPVIVAATAGDDVSGTATIAPDAYFYTATVPNNFQTTVVAAKSDAPKGVALGNVVTDCERAQERALANAIRVAEFDGPVRSFLAQPAQLLSIACLPAGVIGHTYDSLPTVYNDSSPTGAPTATDEITVYR